jgi:hypothetical protein
MHLKPRHLLAALGLLSAVLPASAQLVELITEAPVTIELTFGTATKTSTGTGSSRADVTTAYTSRITNAQILEALRLRGDIPDPTIANWSLYAVRGAPSDLAYINARFFLYAVKRTSPSAPVMSSFAVPSEVFSFATNLSHSVAAYTERHQGQSIFSSAGTVTNYSRLRYTPTFTRSLPPVVAAPVNGARISTVVNSDYTVTEMFSSGFATISYATRSTEPVFFYPISRLVYNSVGDFSGTQISTTIRSSTPTSPRNAPSTELDRTTAPAVNESGLVSTKITVGPAVLTPRSVYPEVPFEDDI